MPRQHRHNIVCVFKVSKSFERVARFIIIHARPHVKSDFFPILFFLFFLNDLCRLISPSPKVVVSKVVHSSRPVFSVQVPYR